MPMPLPFALDIHRLSSHSLDPVPFLFDQRPAHRIDRGPVRLHPDRPHP